MMEVKETTVKQALGFAVVALVASGLAIPVAARVKYEVQRDKTFDFKTVRTWAWHPEGAGEVKVLQKSGDDPEKIRARLEPTILQSVEEYLAGRGYQKVSAGEPDLHVAYYLLIGAGLESQYMGQFVGSSPEWGLPPFAGATTSLKIYEQGSLVLDVKHRAQNHVVWRGIARAELDRLRSEPDRLARVREAVHGLTNRLPRNK
jgi:hypothetical protein